MEDLKLNKQPRSPEFESFYDRFRPVRDNLFCDLDDPNWWQDVYTLSQIEARVLIVTGAIKWELSIDKMN